MNGISEGLTSRQTQILKVLIDEYINTAYPVGSEAIEKKYDLGVSPATIRHEMATLTNSGFLRQPHTSAGRVPTPKAMRFYVDQLMEEKKMSLADEVRAKEEVWDSRNDIKGLLEKAVQSLSDRTQSLTVGVTDSGYTSHAGMANVFANAEFANMQVCSDIFSLIEGVSRLQDLFFDHLSGEDVVEVLFGEELGMPNLGPVGIVATSMHLGNHKAAIGIIGPTRIGNHTVIPVMRYYSQMLREVFGA